MNLVSGATFIFNRISYTVTSIGRRYGVRVNVNFKDDSQNYSMPYDEFIGKHGNQFNLYK